MDRRVARLKTLTECENLERNALERGNPALATEARQRAVQIRATEHGANSAVERECLEAIYAYEQVLSQGKKRRARASRTWQMIKRHGIIPAVEKVVTKREVSSGFAALEEIGLQEYAFEAVVLRYPGHFSAEAVEVSQQRMSAK